MPMTLSIQITFKFANTRWELFYQILMFAKVTRYTVDVYMNETVDSLQNIEDKSCKIADLAQPTIHLIVTRPFPMQWVGCENKFITQ